MNPWNLILATVIIFGAGVITGGLLVDHVDHSHGKPAHHAPVVVVNTNRPPVEHPLELTKPRTSEILSQQFVHHLDELLQLSPSQLEAIQKIVVSGQEQNHAISTNTAAQYKEVLLDVRLHIREELTTDQRKQFEDFMRQMHPSSHRPAGTNAVPSGPPGTNNDSILHATNVVTS